MAASRVRTSTGSGGRKVRVGTSIPVPVGMPLISGGAGGANPTMAWRSGRWPSTVTGMPTRPSPSMETRRAMVVASFSGETADGPKRESCARRGGEVDAARVEAVRLEGERELDALGGEALDLHPLRQPLQGGGGDEEER